MTFWFLYWVLPSRSSDFLKTGGSDVKLQSAHKLLVAVSGWILITLYFFMRLYVVPYPLYK